MWHPDSHAAAAPSTTPTTGASISLQAHVGDAVVWKTNRSSSIPQSMLFGLRVILESVEDGGQQIRCWNDAQ